MKIISSFFLAFILFLVPSFSISKEIPKIAVWDLTAGNINPSYAQDLTSILVSEISKLEKYEVYSQENVRTLAGWTAGRMQLGCTDTKCLTALGQMDIAKLISGRVGKIGNRYSVSLNLFDTQNARAEKSVSEFGRSEDELIDLIQVGVRKLLGVQTSGPVAEQNPSVKETKAAAVSGMGQPFKDPVIGMKFAFIKGGCFEMGDIFGDGFDIEKPIHTVCVDDFYLGIYEVTQEQWEKVMGSNPSDFKKGGNYPVENVSWHDVQIFIQSLNRQSGRKYRLPTEAEWEYAARSGGKKEKFSGTSREEELDQYAWYSNNSGSRTHPVGQKNPNGSGLYDMTGNVWEWCADWYDASYYKNSSDNPRGPEKALSRVLRGGSWGGNPRSVRASFRNWIHPSLMNNDLGFRLGTSAR